VLNPKVSLTRCTSMLSCPKLVIPKASQPSTFSGVNDSPASTLPAGPVPSRPRAGHPTPHTVSRGHSPHPLPHGDPGVQPLRTALMGWELLLHNLHARRASPGTQPAPTDTHVTHRTAMTAPCGSHIILLIRLFLIT